jgi:predicted nucleic acid-binding protein
LNSEFRRSLRRIKPEKHNRQLSPRQPSELLYIGDVRKPVPKLLLDTTVYIDALQGRLPVDADAVLSTAELWHSTVTEAEIAAACGLLDPEHPRSSDVIKQLTASVEKRPEHRILGPDRGAWREAGMLSGLLARLQGYDSAHRRQVLNDALIFCTALKHGCTVLTRNTADFDLLQQLLPSGRVLFYKQG